MKKIISFCLYGNNKKYILGAIENAKLALKIYPDWIPRYYCGTSISKTILNKLKNLNAEVIVINSYNDNRSKFWRFYALSDPNASHIIIRDTDSRLSIREFYAVNEWIQSGMPAHIMRDHPYHIMPIMAGMWGCKGGIFKNIKHDIDLYNPQDIVDDDQIFLKNKIYPRILDLGVYVHDEFFNYESCAKKFSLARNEYEFVGEIYNSTGCRAYHWKVLKDYYKNPIFRFKFILKKLKLKFLIKFFKY